MRVTIGSLTFTEFGAAVSYAMRRYKMTRKRAEAHVRQLEIRQRDSNTQAKKQQANRISSEMKKSFSNLVKDTPKKKAPSLMSDKMKGAYNKMEVKAQKQKSLESRMSAQMAKAFRKMEKETLEETRKVRRKVLGRAPLDRRNKVTSGNPVSLPGDVTVDASITYQTWEAWGATGDAGDSLTDDLSLGTPYAGQPVPTAYANYIGNVLDNCADIRIGHIRLAMMQATNLEHTTDYWQTRLDGDYTEAEYNATRFLWVNDNDDPDVRNDSGFIWTLPDWKEAVLWGPLATRMAAEGITLERMIMMHSIDIITDVDEYAEHILAKYDHLNDTFGWTPDVMYWNEPDLNGFSAAEICARLPGIVTRLEAAGYTPKFSLPGCLAVNQAYNYMVTIRATMGDAWCRQYVRDINYHRYAGDATTYLPLIAAMAKDLGIQTYMSELTTAGADTLYDDLVNGNVSRWDRHVICSRATSGNGTYFYNNVTDPDNPVTTYVGATRNLRQYMHYIKQGAVRMEATTTHASLFPTAWLNADGAYTIIIYASAAVTNFVVAGLRSGQYNIEYSTGSAPVQLSTQSTKQRTITTSIPAAGAITIYEVV